MKRTFTSLIAIMVVAALMTAIPGRSVTAQSGDAATPAAMSMGAAYLTIANSGTDADKLIGGSTTVASTVEIHEIVDVDGVMKMQPLADGLEIPAGGSVELKPGGYHIMLIGLTESLTDGMTYELTLTFATTGDVKLMVPVYVSEDAAMAATPATPVTAGTLTLSNFWSRSAPAMGAESDATSGATAAGFMVITNAGTEADKLIAVKTDVAATAEVHQMKEGSGGVMEMSPVEGGLEIPAGGSVELKSGSFHVMLIGLKEDLTSGTSYELTLTFEKAGDVTIVVPVQANAMDISTPAAPVTVGSITISGQWTRMAPAMNGNSEMDMGEGTPASGM